MEEYLTPDQVCELVPGMSRSGLAQLRFKGGGPVFLKPTPRKVIYRKSDVIAWVEASARSSTVGVV